MSSFGKADRIFIDEFGGIAERHEGKARVVTEFQIGHHAASTPLAMASRTPSREEISMTGWMEIP